MTKQQSALILLIKSALTDESYPLPADFDPVEVFRIAKVHGVNVMAYYGALRCGVAPDSDWMTEELMHVYQSISVGEKQMAAVHRLMDTFEDHGIAHMPLKGTLQKALYPRTEMRKMGDADILINCDQYDTICGIMKELGYTEKYESDHELAWYKKAVHIELHKRLIPSYNKDYYRYYGDGWRIAKPHEGYTFRYCMDPRDEMIYLFTHFAKHYRDAGIGIRHLVDLWVFRKNHPMLDEKYIRKELAKLQLLEFYENIMLTLGVWFDDIAADEKTEFITQVIFTSGEYSRAYISKLSSVLKTTKNESSVESIKRKRIIRLLFPEYTEMCRKYQILQKFPFLLPFMWWRRIFSQMFRFKKLQLFVKKNLQFSTDEVSEYQQSLHYVGLDFHFSE